MACVLTITCLYQYFRPGRHDDVDKGEMSGPKESAALERFKSQNLLGRTNSGGVRASSEPWLF